MTLKCLRPYESEQFRSHTVLWHVSHRNLTRSPARAQRRYLHSASSSGVLSGVKTSHKICLCCFVVRCGNPYVPKLMIDGPASKFCLSEVFFDFEVNGSICAPKIHSSSTLVHSSGRTLPLVHDSAGSLSRFLCRTFDDLHR